MHSHKNLPVSIVREPLAQSDYDRLAAENPAGFMGKKILFFQELGSTNDYAREYFIEKRERVREGTLVIAAHQTRGRGQFDRTWYSPIVGGVYLSFLLRPPHMHEKALPFLSLMAGVAAAETLECLTGVPFNLKYPNDLFLFEKKIGGILVERVAGTGLSRDVMNVVLGLGVNLSTEVPSMPPDLQETASSISSLSGVSIPPLTFIRELCVSMEKWYSSFLSKDFHGIVECWKGRMKEIPDAAQDKLESLISQIPLL